MASESGKKALDQASAAWKQAQGTGPSMGAGPVLSADTDSHLASGQHDRNYNPVDSATRGNVSANLNADAARYKKGPGPV